MTVPAALRELDKIEMVRGGDNPCIKDSVIKTICSHLSGK